MLALAAHRAASSANVAGMRHYNVDRFLLVMLQSLAGIVPAFLLELGGALASSITGNLIPSLTVSLALLAAPLSRYGVSSDSTAG